MSDVLIRIKRAILSGNYAFSGKARLEMECDDLTEWMLQNRSSTQ